MTTTSVSDPLLETVLGGRYAITRRIARGGMATVYEATDRRLSRTVAVKVMHEGLGDDDDFAGRFDREARSAARLNHPNIVSVFDRGNDDGRPYIVMEYVPGITMRRVISRQAPIVPIRALSMIEDVLLALIAAHDSNLVHRDIKPENVLIDERGEVKVADFGLARAITTQSATATQGLLIGTVSYLPPELVTEGRATTRSDVYSTGVVLYELLTGVKPHTGDSPIQVAYAHVHNDIPAPSEKSSLSWRVSRDAIPPYVDALVRAATRRDPQERPADARELLRMVRRAKRSLAAGVMNDPGLTADFQRRFSTTPPLPATPVSPLSPEERTQFLDDEATHDGSTRIEPPVTPDVVEPAELAEPERPKRWRGVLATLLMLALLAGLGAGWWVTEGRWHDVPDMVSLTQPDATEAAEDAGLTITFSEAHHEDVPAGTIISTEPTAGERLLADQEVHAVVSIGPEMFGVPEVVGGNVDDARTAIEDANLRVGNITEQWDETSPMGTVLESSISPGQEVRRNTAIDLTVSKGPEPIQVPTTVGGVGTDAQTQLENLGFHVAVSQEHSTDVPEGQVIRQSPTDTTLHRGDTVEIVTSLGPEMVTMPNVTAKKVEEAEKTLTEAGFTIKKEKSESYLDLGFVARTDPVAGTKVPKGSEITIWLV